MLVPKSESCIFNRFFNVNLVQLLIDTKLWQEQI